MDPLLGVEVVCILGFDQVGEFSDLIPQGLGFAGSFSACRLHLLVLGNDGCVGLSDITQLLLEIAEEVSVGRLNFFQLLNDLGTLLILNLQ
jgi:hypothetical protein